MKATWRVWLVLAMDGWLLWAHRPNWWAMRNDVISAQSHSVDGADHYVAELAGAALWLAAGWLALGLCAVLLGRLPGRSGAMWRAVAAAILPRAARTVLITVTTTSMAVSTVTGTASASGSDVSSAALGRPVASSPSWPTTPPATQLSRAGEGTSPQWPLAPGIIATTPKRQHPAQAAQPPHPAQPAQPTTSPAAASGSTASSSSIVVRPGDSLWSIAARQLGPQARPDQVAASWPRWYEANRSAIGDDPSLLRPGTVLANPEGTGR